jgi:heptosyltransferase-2
MTTPVIMRLRREFPKAEISVVVGPKAAGLLRQSRHIQEVIVYDKRAKLKDKKDFLKLLRQKKWDWVVDLRHTAIPVLVKNRKRSPILRRHRKKMKREAHLEVLGWMGLEPCATEPFDFYQNSDQLSLLAQLRRLGVTEDEGWIVIAPGAASERKRWGSRNFRELAEKLGQKTGRTILLAGSPEEKGIAEKVALDLGVRAAVVCGETNLAESAAMIARAALVVANDSAMMHLGFELKVPTVGIFGPTEHKHYGHIGPQFRIAAADPKLCACEDHLKPKAERSCFHGLNAEQVFKLCEDLLPAGGRSPESGEV